ncbi:MAG: hypothetical protein QME61_00250 [Patescibacteria group bacterium]|nr:hypothetical protein [Patescibacteria group bacterium]
MKKKIIIGGWELNIGLSKFVDRELIEELERFLTDKWKRAVLEGIDHPWWSIKHLGIPSPVIRVDMAPVTESKEIKESIYEVEVRPAGLGVMLQMENVEIYLSDKKNWPGVSTKSRVPLFLFKFC